MTPIWDWQAFVERAFDWLLGFLVQLDPLPGIWDWARYLQNFWVHPPSTEVVGLLATTLATTGWLFTARRSKNLNRQQHSFNALLTAEFNTLYNDNVIAISWAMGNLPLPDLTIEQNRTLRKAFEFILNHYEFIAAAIRLGDVSERMLKNSERGTVVGLFNATKPYIDAVRVKHRVTAYEHLEWLHDRWHLHQPGYWQRFLEWLLQRPLYRRRNRWWSLLIVFAFVAASVLSHLFGPVRLEMTSHPRSAPTSAAAHIATPT